jgi:hypothetical protein
VEWIHWAPGMERWRAFLNTVMNLGAVVPRVSRLVS